jgi:prevent-host-death family protein
MSVIKVTDARAKLYRLIDEVAASHEPITISGKRASVMSSLN